MGNIQAVLSLVFLFPCLLLVVYIWNLRSTNAQRRTAILKQLGVEHVERKRIVAFFHPYCNAGGGGERVLWTAIAALQRTEPDVINVVYSGDTDASKSEIISKVKSRFDITLDPSTLAFVFLTSRSMVEDATWPRFTLLGQSIGSMYVAWEAISKLVPDLFIDTMGYAFTFHVVALLASIPIGAYVHYPTISTNMLRRVRSRQSGPTNTDSISSSSFLSQGKLVYYRFFMYYYAMSLRTADFLMVNSSWTKSHIDSILQHSDPTLDLLHLLTPLVLFRIFRTATPPQSARIVYPPCDTREMAQLPLEGRERIILSIAQFRPEKDHPAQLRAFNKLLQLHPEYATSPDQLKLVLVGGSRNSSDAARVESLRQLAKGLGIEERVQIVVNASYPEMFTWLSRASIGLSTMIDEHFGINIVEFMAAGVIPVAHASGGPLKDIVVPLDGRMTGYHANTSEEFALALHTILTLPNKRARTVAITKFSEAEFEKGWNASGWRAYLFSP
ncbi:mannosyltransferase [Infundibulicybe gibba]|nr:mannosyltransferase [Infundibulicybe gibba]